MATYVTITSTTSYVDTEFNTLSVPADFVRSRWRKEELVSVYLKPDGTVGVRASRGITDYLFSSYTHPLPGTIPVESVNDISPTSNSHLYELIAGCVN